MTFSSNVAPKKIKKPAGKSWDCKCRRQPGYLAWCHVCKKERPK